MFRKLDVSLIYCHRYETTELTYNLALEKCKNASKSAELVGIHFEAENAAIHTIAGRDQVDLWTGFRDNMVSRGYSIIRVQNGGQASETTWWVRDTVL